MRPGDAPWRCALVARLVARLVLDGTPRAGMGSELIPHARAFFHERAYMGFSGVLGGSRGTDGTRLSGTGGRRAGAAARADSGVIAHRIHLA